MSNPIAKVSLYRFDGELRGTVLRTYEGASLLPLGDHDVYAAPVTAANKPEPVNQQLLAALNNVLDLFGGVSWRDLDLDGKPALDVVNEAHAAIAAAEAAQPVAVAWQRRTTDWGGKWKEWEYVSDPHETGWKDGTKLETLKLEARRHPKQVQVRELYAAQQPASAQPVAVPDERAAFEAWADEKGLDLERDGEGYYDTDTHFAWEAWEDRAMLSAAQKPEGV